MTQLLESHLDEIGRFLIETNRTPTSPQTTVDLNKRYHTLLKLIHEVDELFNLVGYLFFPGDESDLISHSYDWTPITNNPEIIRVKNYLLKLVVVEVHKIISISPNDKFSLYQVIEQIKLEKDEWKIMTDTSKGECTKIVDWTKCHIHQFIYSQLDPGDEPPTPSKIQSIRNLRNKVFAHFDPNATQILESTDISLKDIHDTIRLLKSIIIGLGTIFIVPFNKPEPPFAQYSFLSIIQVIQEKTQCCQPSLPDGR